MRIVYVCHRLITFILNEIIELEKLHHDINILSVHKDRRIYDSIVRPILIEHHLNHKTHLRVTTNQSRKKRFINFIRIIFSDFIKRPLITFKSIYYLLKIYDKMGLGIEDFFDIRPLLASKYDVIHAPFSTPKIIDKVYYLSKVLNIPYTLSFRAHDLYESDHFDNALKRRNIISKASKLITISDYNKSLLEKRLGLNKEIDVIHGAVNFSFFKPDNTQKKENSIISVCRFHEQKGIIYLIKACRILNQRGVSFNCTLIGEGPEKGYYKKAISDLRIPNIFFLDYLNREKVKAKLSESTIFVLPCVIAENGARDILSNAIKEAMAMRLPVITSDICGINELVKDGLSGILVPPKNPLAIANAIEDLFNNKKLRKKMGEAGMKKIEKEFNIKKEAKKLESVFRQVVSTN